MKGLKSPFFPAFLPSGKEQEKYLYFIFFFQSLPKYDKNMEARGRQDDSGSEITVFCIGSACWPIACKPLLQLKGTQKYFLSTYYYFIPFMSDFFVIFGLLIDVASLLKG